MSDNLQFEYDALNVSVTYHRATNNVERTVARSGTEIYRDELHFDKSLVANFDLMSAEEQANLVNAWGAAGIKTRIDDGQFESKQ